MRARCDLFQTVPETAAKPPVSLQNATDLYVSQYSIGYRREFDRQLRVGMMTPAGYQQLCRWVPTDISASNLLAICARLLARLQHAIDETTNRRNCRTR